MQKVTKNTFHGLAGCILFSCFMVQAIAADHEFSIGETYARWVEATNARDIEQWGNFLAPEATFLPPDHPKLLTHEAIMAFYSDLFMDPLFHLDCEQESVVIAVAEDMAWSTGHCRATFSGADGKAAHDKSKWAKVWLRQPNGEWRCTMNSWSSTLAR